jgi:hypothetical protein
MVLQEIHNKIILGMYFDLKSNTFPAANRTEGKRFKYIFPGLRAGSVNPAASV